MSGLRFHAGIHRFASFLAGCVVLLIAAGGLVKSLEAGLSVPDWPLSYGSLNPPRWWQIQNVRAEHGHRLIAGTVAMMTVALAVWIQRCEPRRWVRRTGWLAVATVLAQALLGGITVLFFLPTAISVSHAALAELFLCIVVTLAAVTSRWWLAARPSRRDLTPLARHGTVATALVFVQILVGAVMRHTGAGLAIPDFPLAFGGLVPPRFDYPVAIHYAHRVGAVVVTVAVAWLVVRLWRARTGSSLPGIAGGILLVLVSAQIALGGWVVLSGKTPVINTLHVATGASVLAATLFLTLSAWRLARTGERAADGANRVSAPARLGEAA